jgi:sulfofructose kinase
VPQVWLLGPGIDCLLSLTLHRVHASHYNYPVPSTRKVDLVGVGLNATDTLIHLPVFPQRGSKVEYSTRALQPGGQAASTVVACQTWGLSTRYVGKLGEDDAARLHRDAFAHAGVDAQIVTVPGVSSLQNIIMVDEGERTVLCQRDERMILQPSDLKREWITSARILHVDGFDTAACTLAAQWAREADIPVVADLDESYPGVEALLENVDFIIVSRDFPTQHMREPNLEAALKKMFNRYGARLAAATLGEQGVISWDGQRMLHTPAFKVPIVDTTGAGDIFHAGFIYGLLQGGPHQPRPDNPWPLERQMEFACAAAAMNCMHSGARGGIRSVAAIEELMATANRYRSAALTS